MMNDIVERLPTQKQKIKTNFSSNYDCCFLFLSPFCEAKNRKPYLSMSYTLIAKIKFEKKSKPSKVKEAAQRAIQSGFIFCVVFQFVYGNFNLSSN
jgi:hypothetical protein